MFSLGCSYFLLVRSVISQDLYCFRCRINRKRRFYRFSAEADADFCISFGQALQGFGEMFEGFFGSGVVECNDDFLILNGWVNGFMVEWLNGLMVAWLNGWMVWWLNGFCFLVVCCQLFVVSCFLFRVLSRLLVLSSREERYFSRSLLFPMSHQ